MKKIYYYDDFDSDVVKSKNQDYVLKDNYKWDIFNNKFCLYKIIFTCSY